VALATGLVLVALAALIARPATTDPIVDADGVTVAGSVAELTRVEIGGHDLTLMGDFEATLSEVYVFHRLAPEPASETPAAHISRPSTP
jgi:hypothetical protein